MELQVFPDFPLLKELWPNTAGWPGVEYLYTLPERTPHFLSKGWDAVRGAQYFQVNGPKGEVVVNILCFGEPIRHADPGSMVSEVWIDPELEVRTGLHATEDPPTKETPKTLPEERAGAGAES